MRILWQRISKRDYNPSISKTQVSGDELSKPMNEKMLKRAKAKVPIGKKQRDSPLKGKRSSGEKKLADSQGSVRGKKSADAWIVRESGKDEFLFS